VIPSEGRPTQSLSPFKVGKLVCEKYLNINYISRKTKTTVEVIFKYSRDANSLVKDPLMESNNLRAFIPSFRLVRRGIVKGIDKDIREEKIKEFMESEVKILNK
jgi:alanyl-tRNA synthetase